MDEDNWTSGRSLWIYESDIQIMLHISAGEMKTPLRWVVFNPSQTSGTSSKGGKEEG